MAEISQINHAERQPVNWGKWLLIGVGALVSFLLLVVPTISIFWEALSKGVIASLSTLKAGDMLPAI